ncbi:MAG: ABC transporter substrate-binding protein [Azospirillum sp.]|nr:ABC transporter substrate-binding protein [Azospirillum sp.]MCA3265114.1 ABC transporter substrate-binding protein [Azospirillum sp.]MCZ8122175.1 ABC transporter substrate-binding protein [Magnetospirillum sp.]
MRKSLLIAALAALIAVPAAAQEQPRRGGTFIFAVGGEPDTTDCHAATNFAVIHHLAPHYSTLIKFDPKNYPRIIGDVAREWTIAPDGKTYTFRLNQPIRFHDGSALTSADVKASFERIKTPPQGGRSARRDHFQDVAAIEAPTPDTVVFRLNNPNPAFMTYLAAPFNCIYSAAKLAQDPRYPEKEVMGSGAFRFGERVPGSHWTGTRFDGYFRDGQPYLDGFRAVVMSGAAMLNAVQGGQVMAEFRGISPAERARVAGPRVTFQEANWLSGLILSFNVEQKPFDDVRVRRALSMALDRFGSEEGLARVSQVKATGTLLRPGYEFAPSRADLATYPGMTPTRDMARARAEARRLLQEAGVPNLRFEIMSMSLPPFPTVAVWMIDQWRQIGVTAEQRQAERATYFSSRTSGAFQVMLDFTTEFADEPNFQLRRFISFDRVPGFNVSRHTDRRLDEIFDRQEREIDPAKRKALVRDFEIHLLDMAYTVPLYWFARIVPLATNVRGWDITPSHLLGQDLAGVWLAN